MAQLVHAQLGLCYGPPTFRDTISGTWADPYRKYRMTRVSDMAGETITRAHLSEALYEAVGLCR